MLIEKNIHIDDYDYPLPEERIAFYPAAERDQSKLLVYRHGEISDSRFDHLPDFLTPDDLLIFNDSKVIGRDDELATRQKSACLALAKMVSESNGKLAVDASSFQI